MSRHATYASLMRPDCAQIQIDRDGKMTYVYDNHVFHYIVEDGIVFMCMCDDQSETKKRIPYAFLDDVKDRFKADYGGAVKTAIAFAMNGTAPECATTPNQLLT
jgi:vesicle-associated membrane protein 7